jgi:hypothetical protein
MHDCCGSPNFSTNLQLVGIREMDALDGLGTASVGVGGLQPSLIMTLRLQRNAAFSLMFLIWFGRWIFWAA